MKLLLIAIGLLLLFVFWPEPKAVHRDSQNPVKSFQAYQKARLVGAAQPVKHIDVGTVDDMRLDRPPSISAEFIDTLMCDQYHSSACGTGQIWIRLGLHYHIDPAYAVAFFIHESSAATDPGWAGWKPDGSHTFNIGNIVCAGYPTCYGRFRSYASWEEGIEDWFRLIRVEYIGGRGHVTVDDVVPVYAPSFENDVGNYKNTVSALVAEWRKAQL